MIKKCPRGWSIFIGINIRRFERNQSPRASLSSLFGFKRVLECRLIKMEREFWLDFEREGTRLRWRIAVRVSYQAFVLCFNFLLDWYSLNISETYNWDINKDYSRAIDNLPIHFVISNVD